MSMRIALRSLLRSPVYAFSAVLTIGLGIGANAVVYSFANALFVRPLPFPHERELIFLGAYRVGLTGEPIDDSAPGGAGELDAVHYPARMTTLSSLGAIFPTTFAVIRDGQAESVRGAGVSAALWTALATEPSAGRTYRSDEDFPNAPVAVISHGFQSRVFPGSPSSAVGKSLTVEGVTRTVIGVMPSGFLPAMFPGDIWIPLGLSESTVRIRTATRLHALIGRMKPGVSIQQVNADAARIAKDLQTELPVSHRGYSMAALPLRETLVASGRDLSLTLSILVLVLLGLACFNVVNLALVRAGQRRQEMSTRMALGASAGAIVTMQLKEGLLIGIAGGAVGLVIVLTCLRPLLLLIPSVNPIFLVAGIDWRVLLFVGATSALAGAAVAIPPAILLVRSTMRGALAGGGRRTHVSATEQRIRQLLIAAQVGAAAVLLVASLGMALAMFRLSHIDTGLRERGVYVARLTLPSRYSSIPLRWEFANRVLATLRSTPGVVAAGITHNRFIRGGTLTTSITVEGAPNPDDNDFVEFRRADDGYFDVFNLKPVRGRVIGPLDRDTANAAVVINESFQRRYFKDIEPIGRRIRRTGGPHPWLTVVGVVPDVMDGGAGVSVGPAIYLSFQMSNTAMASVVVHSTLPQGATERIVRDAIRANDPLLPIDDFSSMTSLLGDSLDEQRLRMIVIGTLAVLALLLSGVGVYSVTAYVMSERTREIAVRIAIGAPQPLVIRRLVMSASTWVMAGVIAGLLIAIALRDRWAVDLIDQGVDHGWIYPATGLLLAAIGALAASVPSYRATLLSPADVLRRD